MAGVGWASLLTMGEHGIMSNRFSWRLTDRRTDYRPQNTLLMTYLLRVARKYWTSDVEEIRHLFCEYGVPHNWWLFLAGIFWRRAGCPQVVHVLATDALKWKWFSDNLSSFVSKGKVCGLADRLVSVLNPPIQNVCRITFPSAVEWPLAGYGFRLQEAFPMFSHFSLCSICLQWRKSVIFSHHNVMLSVQRVLSKQVCKPSWGGLPTALINKRTPIRSKASNLYFKKRKQWRYLHQNKKNHKNI